MSNPADIEVAGAGTGVPSWMVDDDVVNDNRNNNSMTKNNGTSIPVSTSNGVPSWMVNDDVVYNDNSNNNNNNNNSNNNNNNNNGITQNNNKNGCEVLPDWSVNDGPVAIGIPAPTSSSLNIKANDITTNTNINNSNCNNNASTYTSNAELASKKTWKEYFRETFSRDGRTLIITLIIIVCMNIPFIKWALYPFTIFSTWIHELCHGMAAVLVGGSISKIMIYPDGSGLAYTSGNRRGFISSAGYQGTAVIGCLLLLFRRTKRGPRTGTMIVAFMMILSCCLWIRNVFGLIFILVFGIVLAVAAWKLPSEYIRDLYIVLGMTCSLNAITSVHDLFGSSYVINGQSSEDSMTMSSDAHTMSEYVGGSYLLWAILWLLLAIILTFVGLVFAVPGPDEVADFTCCGVCQDFGCFKLCNYPGQQCTKRFFGGRHSSRNEVNTNTNANANDNGENATT